MSQLILLDPLIPKENKWIEAILGKKHNPTIDACYDHQITLFQYSMNITSPKIPTPENGRSSVDQEHGRTAVFCLQERDEWWGRLGAPFFRAKGRSRPVLTVHRLVDLLVLLPCPIVGMRCYLMRVRTPFHAK